MTDADPLARVPAELVARMGAARLLALDVDGVLTDGRVVYVGGEELQRFDVRDGAGLVWLIRHGVRVVWITGRGCEATRRRAQELGAELHEHVRDKRGVLERVRATAEGSSTVAMGDDVADLGLAACADLFVAPVDAAAPVRARADWVTAAPGGHGAVRELCEALLAARGAWDAVLSGAGG